MVRIHLIGNWVAGAVRCEWAASTFDPPGEVREAIERAWEEAAGRLGDRLFDGPMCRLEGYRASEERLELRLSRTSYKAFVGTNLRGAVVGDRSPCGQASWRKAEAPHPALSPEYRDEGIREAAGKNDEHAHRGAGGASRLRRWGAGGMANPVGMSCALVSSDGVLMLGYRNDRVAYYPGRIHPFAGAMEPREPLDVFAEVGRELAEELAFGAGDVAEMRCIGMVEDLSLGQPELVFLVRSTRTRKQIEAQLDEAEHRSTFAVDPDEKAIAAALADERLTPVAVGTVELWGKCGMRDDGR